MDKQAKDFFFSFVLFFIGVFVSVGGYLIYYKASQPPQNITSLSLSPGFLPLLLGLALVFCAVLLCLQSLQGETPKKEKALLYGRQFTAWFSAMCKNKDLYLMIGGVAIMAIYAFVIVELLPFEIASLIFLICLMLFIKATKWWKIIIISAVSVFLIVFLFKFCFNAALP